MKSIWTLDRAMLPAWVAERDGVFSLTQAELVFDALFYADGNAKARRLCLA